MSKLKIIIGNSGAKKTEYIYDYFKKHSRRSDKSIDLSKNFYLIVPEQETAIKQKEMMEAMSEYGDGILNIDVISFDRLAYMVFAEQNIDLTKEKIVMDDAKTMILRLALINIKKRKIKLPYFEKSINKIGFAMKLMSCMSEFYTYGITSDVLDSVAEKVKNDTIKQKIKELKIIQDEFLSLIKQKNFFIKEDKLNLLRDNIANTKIFDNAVVAFDGFTGFTPIQNEIFKKIYEKSSEVYITVTMREKEYNEMLNKKNIGIFSLSKKYIESLIKTENFDGFIFIKDNIENEEIKYLEKNLFLYNNDIYNKKVENIEIYGSEKIETEVEFLINKIFYLTKYKKYSYNEIKIVVPSIDDYRDLLIKKFEENDIPLYIDDDNKIYTSPLIEGIKSLLEIIWTNFSKESVLRYINSGLFDKNSSNIYFLIDNFIRKYNLNGYNQYKNNLVKIKTKIIQDINNGKKYKNEISMAISKIVENIEEIIAPIFLFYEEYKAEKYEMTLTKHVEMLEKFLLDANILKKFELFLSDLKNTYTENSREYIVLKDNVEILNKIFNLIKNISYEDDIKINVNEFMKIFDLSIETTNIKTIPYVMDQIVVGDLMRSRVGRPKILIFLGMNDTKIPLVSVDNNIINDEMRKIFENCGVILSQTIEETVKNSRFYLYSILTSPIDKLILSYTKMTANDEIDFKSNVLEEIEKIFGANNLLEKYTSKEKEIFTIDSAKKYLANNFYDMYIYYKNNNDKNINFDYLKYIKTFEYIKSIEDKESFKSFNNIITNNLKIVNDLAINKNIISNLQTNFRGSATELETYAECPYKHFAKNIINLRTVENGELTDIDVGNISHFFMEWLFSLDREIKFLNGSKKIVNYTTITDLDDEELRELTQLGINENINKIDKLQDGTNKSIFIIDRITDMIENTMINMRDQLKLSEKPDEILVEYGAMDYLLSEDGDIINKKENAFVEVIGRIDKIEIYKKDNKIYVKVIDYKSSEKKLDNEKIENGIQIQLLIYLDYCINYIKNISKTFKKGDEVIPIGAFYSPIMDKIDYIGDFENEIDNYNNIDHNKLSGIINFSDGINIIDKNFDANDKNYKSDVLDLKSKENCKTTEEIEELLKKIREKIIIDLKNIKNGDINVKPYKKNNMDSCEYCPYKNLCRYDDKNNNNEEDE